MRKSEQSPGSQTKIRIYLKAVKIHKKFYGRTIVIEVSSLPLSLSLPPSFSSSFPLFSPFLPSPFSLSFIFMGDLGGCSVENKLPERKTGGYCCSNLSNDYGAREKWDGFKSYSRCEWRGGEAVRKKEA